MTDVAKQIKALEDRVDMLARELQWLRYERSHKQVVQNYKPWGGCEVCGLGSGKIHAATCTRSDCPTKITSIPL